MVDYYVDNKKRVFKISDFTIVKIRNQNRTITQFFTVLLLGEIIANPRSA